MTAPALISPTRRQTRRLVGEPILGTRLHRGHFAMARGWVQGMPLEDLARRYLAGIAGDASPDLRVARSTLELVLDQLAAAARRTGRGAEAGLLKRQSVRVRLPADPAIPSLDEFGAGLEPGFHSEAEAIELYQTQYGAAAAGSGTATRAAARRARLIERQLRLLADLERELAAPFTLGSAVADWFEPRLAARLHAAGVVTVAQLVERIRGYERRWWTGIAAVGEAKAARIRRFVEAMLGPIASGRALALAYADPQIAKPAEFAIVPLERLHVPAHLDGRAGRFRAPRARSTIQADTDHQAIQTYLASKTSTHTRVSYRRELERFLLWALLERGVAVSSVTLEDCLQYRAFLADPQPASQWCGPRGTRRWSPRWRPFEGPLSAASQKQALVILGGFFEWAIRVGYLTANPFASVSAGAQAIATEAERSASAADEDGLEDAQRTGAKSVLERTLTRDQIEHVLATIDALPACGRTRRMRFALQFAYGTGLRLSELVRARRGHLHYLPADAEQPGGWLLRVLGKRHRRRDVPVPEHVIAALSDYLESRGLGRDLAEIKRGTYLLGAVDDIETRLSGAHVEADGAVVLLGTRRVEREDGVKAITVYRDLKGAFEHAAFRLHAKQADAAVRLEVASVHWLRHSLASHAVEADTPLDVVRDTLGHASIATTSIYVRSLERRRLVEMRRLWSRNDHTAPRLVQRDKT